MIGPNAAPMAASFSAATTDVTVVAEMVKVKTSGDLADFMHVAESVSTLIVEEAVARVVSSAEPQPATVIWADSDMAEEAFPGRTGLPLHHPVFYMPYWFGRGSAVVQERRAMRED